MMKKSEVKIGETYRVKVSGNIANVRITGESPYGGWEATNTVTKKKVRIKSAQRLRGLATTKKAAAVPTGGQAGKTAPEKAKAETPQVTSAVKTTATEPKPQKKPVRKDGTMSGLDAAAKVLAEAGEPLNCKTIVERALAKGYWKTGGKTPSATVYAAIIREIAKKGDASRFAKADRGKFTLKA